MTPPTWTPPEFCEINLSAEIGMYCEHGRGLDFVPGERGAGALARPLSIIDPQPARRA